MKRSTSIYSTFATEPLIQNKTPWWFAVGSLLFLTRTVLGWAEIKFLNLEVNEKRLWKICLKHFCISCLVCSGCDGFGFTMNTIKKLFNNLVAIPLSEVAKVLEAAAPLNFLKSDLKYKVFDFKFNLVGKSYSLFNMTFPSYHPHRTWLNEPDCISLQQGLKLLFVDHVECALSALKTHFVNYEPHYEEFEFVDDFALWWCDANQKPFNRVRKDSTVMGQLNLFGKQNLQATETMTTMATTATTTTTTATTETTKPMATTATGTMAMTTTAKKTFENSKQQEKNEKKD